MRPSSDLPGGRRRPRSSRPDWASKGRIILLVVVAVVVALFLSARTLANFYVDLLWFDSVDSSSVFWTSIWSKAFLAAFFSVGFAVVAFISLTLAERLGPADLPIGPEREVVERYRLLVGNRTRLLRLAVSVVFGLMVGLPAIAQWQEWLLFRNSQSFGTSDPLFDVDVGFYVFRLPFLTFVVDWAFAALVLITMVTAALHFLNGAIRVQTPGDRITRGARIHLSVLFALLALIKAADYWLQRFELTLSSRGVVQGATYTDVKAQLPAINLLIMVSLLVAVLFLAGIRWGGWRFPILSMALWAVVAVVAGTVYPAVIQRFIVQPNVTTRERPYIGDNITATQAAMGIDNIEVVSVTAGTVTSADVAADPEPLTDTRLLDIGEMRDRFALDEGLFAFYSINDLDVDRYEIGGRRQQAFVAARELNPEGIPNKTWVSRHLIYTHGCGVVAASASQVTSDGRPIYQEIAADNPQLYVGTQQPGYAIVKTDQVEQACPDTAPDPYQGEGGVELNSTLRRLAFAVHFGEFNLIGSSLVKDESRLIHVRDVSDRVTKLAPFLHLDADPYPVVDKGRVLWIVDAFTTTSRYPYAQQANTDNLTPGSGLKHSFNYVRNSVKAVVDAYDGSVTLYVVDPMDPIVRAWSKAFPGLFTPSDQVPASLREHFRYPEDLFRVQTNLYGRYQFDNADQFFNRDSAWSVAQAVKREPELAASATDVTLVDEAQQANTGDVADANVARFEPYYTLFHPPQSGNTEVEPTFSLLRPFVPFSADDTRKELRAVMVVSSDPATYGQITVYKYEGTLTEGPATVSAELISNPEIAPVITLLDQRGSRVVLGQLQLVSIGDGLIWVQPLFVRPDDAGSRQVFVRRILAWYEGRSVIGDTLSEAVNRLFPGANIDLGEFVEDGGTSAPDTGTDSETGGDSGGSGEPDTGTDGSTGTVADDPAELLQAAEALFDEADAALRDGDLGTYQSKVDQAQELISRALVLLSAG
ncbi:MAG: UPF0182 family protein [Ilumatobacteraceae bacterium]